MLCACALSNGWSCRLGIANVTLIKRMLYSLPSNFTKSITQGRCFTNSFFACLSDFAAQIKSGLSKPRGGFRGFALQGVPYARSQTFFVRLLGL